MLNTKHISGETYEVRAEAVDNAIEAIRKHELEIMLPPEFAMDVLMSPAFAMARPAFRSWCLGCIKELPGISEIDRDRLCAMVASGL